MSESQYVGTLLLGGNISQFSNQDADAKQLLAVYNRAWGQALAASGFTLDPKATSLQSAQVDGALHCLLAVSFLCWLQCAVCITLSSLPAPMA
jgi:hypothetical protein